MMFCFPLAYGQTFRADSVPFYVGKFLSSRFTAKAIVHDARADAFTAIILWMESFRQNPAGTLPDDDLMLARLAGFGRNLGDWQRAKEGALYGWRPTHVRGAPSHLSFLAHPQIERLICDDLSNTASHSRYTWGQN